MRCPKCNNEFSKNIILENQLNLWIDYYLFKCPHCNADLEIPHKWFALVFMVCLLPAFVLAFNMKMSGIFAKEKAVLLILLFLIGILLSLIFMRFIFWRIIRPRYLSVPEAERVRGWLIETRGIAKLRDVFAKICIWIFTIVLLAVIFYHLLRQ